MNRLKSKLESNALLFSWLAVAFMAMFIFVMSARSGFEIDNNTGIFTVIKNALSQAALAIAGHDVDVSPIGHFCEFFVFGLALQNALTKTFGKRKAPAVAIIVLAIVLASAYGATDEFHQLFVPGRSCDPADWLVDTIAATIGILSFNAMKKRR